MGDIRDTEKAMLNESMPLLNAIGADAAASHPLINAAVRAQLVDVRDEADYYVKDPKQMPHEWGSMDSYDDMRNSVTGLSMLLEALLDGPCYVDHRKGTQEEEDRQLLREVVRECPCAVAREVVELAYPGMGDDERYAAEQHFHNVESQREGDEQIRAGLIDVEKWDRQSEEYAYEEAARRAARGESK